MAKIIAIRGKRDVGKTYTIRAFISLLVTKGIKINILRMTKKEISATFDYKDKHIGVTTRGDPGGYLQIDFNLLGECDIYICACRTKGSTNKFLEDEVGKDNVIYLDVDHALTHEEEDQLAIIIWDTLNKLI